MPTIMNDILVSARKPQPLEMLLTSEQHARLAQAYANPDPDLSPEAVQWWQRLARYHAVLSRRAQALEMTQAFFTRAAPQRRL
jgi:hypothetical protein